MVDLFRYIDDFEVDEKSNDKKKRELRIIEFLLFMDMMVN